MRLLNHNYPISVIVTAFLCTYIFLLVQPRLTSAKTIAVVEQNYLPAPKAVIISASKPGYAITLIISLDFQMNGIAACVQKKNGEPLTKISEKQTNIYETNLTTTYEIC